MLSFLRGLLANRIQEANNLTNQKNDLQNQVNDLNQQLTLADNAINTLHQELNQRDGEIRRLENKIRELEEKLNLRPNITQEYLNQLRAEINNLGTQRDNRPDIALRQWNDDYKQRPTQQQLTNLQNELSKERDWWEKWINDNREKIAWLSRNPFANHLVSLVIAISANSSYNIGHGFDESDLKSDWNNTTAKKVKIAVKEYIDSAKQKYYNNN